MKHTTQHRTLFAVKVLVVLLVTPAIIALIGAGYLRVTAPRPLYLGDSMIALWDTPANVYNAGIGSETSSDVLYRWRAQYRGGSWSRVLIWCGTNDVIAGVSNEHYEDNLRELIYNMKQRGITDITIMGILPPGHSQTHLIDIKRVSFLDNWLQYFAAQSGVKFVNLYQVIGDDGLLIDQYTNDGIHLNVMGYAVAFDRQSEVYLEP